MNIDRFQHEHEFGNAARHDGERRTRWVVALTVVMMAVEVTAGLVFGSMALLADGWHMGTHAAALGVAVFAYAYARRHATDPRFTFGTGKVSALAGFASAVGLLIVALVVFGESVVRLARPVPIHFDEAIVVAVVGLLVNLVSAWLLRDHDHGDEDHGHHADHNLRGAYLHVIADALTSVLAILALLAGRFLGWSVMDPVVGLLGAVVITRWSLGLLRDTSAVLLDAEISPERRAALRAALEVEPGVRVADLHVWRVGRRHLALVASVVAAAPASPDHYRALLGAFPDLAHVTIEVHRGGP